MNFNINFNFNTKNIVNDSDCNNVGKPINNVPNLFQKISSTALNSVLCSLFNSESQNNSMTSEKTIASSSCQMKDFLERFEESQKNNSVSNAKRKTPSFKPNPNYKGSVTNGKDRYMYFENKDNHTRATLVDRDNDGKIDSASYFQDDENGRTIKSSFDFDNDGKIDEVLTFKYDDDGNMIGRYTDSDNDGNADYYEELEFKNGQYNVKEKYTYIDDKENHTRTTLVDRDNDGKIDSASYFQDDENGRTIKSSFDFDNDGKIDEVLKFEYDTKGNMIGRYTDSDNDGIFDSYDKIENNEIVSTKKINKRYNG